ncbi:MAG: hypothetical protein P9X26_02295 [Candidatus Stygibacter frigidus]|nr:hypothetical protein [Candidatus Stygibacter frigidus]
MWIEIANIIALPLAWYAMQKWLINFAYKIDITPDIFLISICLSLFIAMISICYHSIKAEIQNSIKALKYE